MMFFFIIIFDNNLKLSLLYSCNNYFPQNLIYLDKNLQKLH